jgi:hypothetical protein
MTLHKRSILAAGMVASVKVVFDAQRVILA